MSNIPLTIRKATIEDVPRLSELGSSVFLQSYQHPYNQADMDAYLREKLSIEVITEELRREAIYYFVAQTDKIVGFIKFNTYMWTPRFKGKITFEVERLYIQKNMEGKNIGSRLIKTALDVAKQKHYTIIWLSVWENNERAIAFHQRHGFVIIGDGLFRLGKAERKYLVMQKKVISGE